MKKNGGVVSGTLKYTCLNAAYFVAFCTLHAYAAVFLLANGFSNTEVGILLAVANIVSAVLQPVIAGIIDKPGFLTNKRFILISVAVIFTGSLILMFVPGIKVCIGSSPTTARAAFPPASGKWRKSAAAA